MQEVSLLIVAQAVRDICNGLLWEYAINEAGFSVTFSMRGPINQEIFEAIKVRVRKLSLEDTRIVPMDARSCKELLKHHGLYNLAKGVETGIVKVFQGEGIASVVEDEKIPGGIILSHYKSEEKELSIFGIGAADQKSARQALARVKRGKEIDHRLRTDLFFKEKGSYCWTARGMKLREKIKKEIEDLYTGLGCKQVRGPFSNLGEKVWQWTDGETGRGILEGSAGTEFQLKIEGEKLLHSLHRWPKLFELPLRLFLNDEEVENCNELQKGDHLVGYCEDGYGTLLRVVDIQVEKAFSGTLAESIEKILLLQAERG